MKKLSLLSASALVLLVAFSPLRAEPEKPDEPVSLSLVGEPLSNALPVMAQVIGLELDHDSSVTGSITLDVENAPWYEVMDEICAQLDCRWEIRDDPPVLRVESAASAD